MYQIFQIQSLTLDPKSSSLKQQILNKSIKGFIISQNLSPHLIFAISFPGAFAYIFAFDEDL